MNRIINMGRFQASLWCIFIAVIGGFAIGSVQ